MVIVFFPNDERLTACIPNVFHRQDLSGCGVFAGALCLDAEEASIVADMKVYAGSAMPTLDRHVPPCAVVS